MHSGVLMEPLTTRERSATITAGMGKILDSILSYDEKTERDIMHHGKSKDSGRTFFMYGGKEQRNPPPRFEAVAKTKEGGQERETVDLVLERGVREIARGQGKLEDLSLAGAQIVEASFNGNPTIFPGSDHVQIVVTSAGKLKGFEARGDIKGVEPEKGLTINLQFSPVVSPQSTRIFYAWRGRSPNALEPIGKKVFRDRRQRPR